MSLRFVLIGHPVAHSLSPVIHQAAYRELGVAHAYELVDAADEQAVRFAIEELRSGRVAGMNVTIPWKRLALALADRAVPAAERLGAANVLARSADGQIIAHNSDVPALVEEFRARVPGLRRAAVIGSGGAALAAIAACQESGAVEVGVTSRRWADDQEPNEWSNAARIRELGAATLSWPASAESARRRWQDFVERSELIVQATSAGMHGADPGESVATLVAFEKLAPATLAYDLVYSPPDTPFVTAARRAGLAATHGLPMLVGQAALSLDIWLGARVRREPLLSAALGELARRGRA